MIDGAWQLIPIRFEENWDLERRREIAADVEKHMNVDQVGIGAFEDGRVIGFITLGRTLFGCSARYAEIVCFQVPAESRGKGVGRRLFTQACEEARRLGAEKLYISAHSSRESQAAYARLGCVHAAEINDARAAEEPFDVQMEYRL